MFFSYLFSLNQVSIGMGVPATLRRACLEIAPVRIKALREVLTAAGTLTEAGKRLGAEPGLEKGCLQAAYGQPITVLRKRSRAVDRVLCKNGFFSSTTS